MGRLFAISDIHGCFKPFYELVNKTIKLRKSDHLMLLGDYIDRGEDSKAVLDFIIDLQKSGFNVTPLMGNHEVLLINSWYDPDGLSNWLMNNGISTLNSFRINDIKQIDSHYLTFLTSLEYFKIIGNLIFVHAGFDDQAIDPFSEKHSMIWECYPNYQNSVFAGKTIIHGHRPKTISHIIKLISGHSAVIPIDSGCVYGRGSGYGYLSALELNSMSLYSVPNDY